MKKIAYAFFALISFTSLSCNSVTDKSSNKDPKKMLQSAYQLFKEGKDAESIKLAEEVLTLGKETKNDTLIGRALTSLCRNAQRDLDTLRLADLSKQLKELAEKSGNEKWLMYRAHQNAEMWRLVGNMERADSFYVESMRISKATGSDGMYMIDHFNKSFVATAKGNYQEANDLIKKYYDLRLKANEKATEPTDPYGLIALAYLLESQSNYPEAYEVTLVTRRLFQEQNIFPEPPDEKPLLAVEKTVAEKLDQKIKQTLTESAKKETVSSLLKKYLK